MKKFLVLLKKLLIVALIGFGLWFFAVVGWFLFYGFGGLPLEMPIPAESLMNKTKEEILQILFAEDAPRVLGIDNKVNIAYAPEGKDYAGYNLYFDVIEDARGESRLMNSNIWDIYPTESIFTNGTYSWQVTFKDGKVEKVEKMVLREFSLL